MSEVGAIGDLVNGGLLARSVEPATGAVAGDGHTHEAACLNCGTLLVGEHCHACGQRGHVHRTLGAFFHDLLHGVFHFEGKIWTTLPLLAWQPGRLTRDYIEGKRASFVSPIALFLFCIFLMFAVVSATGNLNPEFNNVSKRNLATAQQETEDKLAAIGRERQLALASHRSTQMFDARIKDKQNDLAVIKTLRTRGLTEAALTSAPDLTSNLPWMEDAYRKAKQNPQLLLYMLKNNAYKWSWALIPLSVPFVWLLFPFSRRFRLYDHIVFVTYSLCFMSLLVILGSGLAFVGAAAVGGLLVFFPPFHRHLQLRGAYALGRWSALWRTAALMFAALLVLTIYVVLMVALGLLD